MLEIVGREHWFKQVEWLRLFGQDLRSPGFWARETLTLEALISEVKVRNKDGRLVRLIPNRAQTEYSRTCGRRNIVLKARQLGMTTYIAARFFIRTITKPGTLSVQVAHDQQSAEEIFRIVHRFLENLPEELRDGALRTSRANVRQLVFPRLEAVTSREIVDGDKFRDGLGKIIDGVVQCLNASAWAKAK
jgi:hypothetical protein